MKYNIALINGDGIGPEIIDSAVRVLQKAVAGSGTGFVFTEYAAGGTALDTEGIPLPEKTVKGCLSSDSVLLGAVGGPKWDSLPGNLRPEKSLLGIRSAMGLYTNIRPAVLFASLRDASPLRADIAAKGFDIVVVRELTGGMYFGDSGRRTGVNGTEAYDTECYSAAEIERIGRAAFETAAKRKKKLVSIDKANVLESSRLWRETMRRLAGEYPDIALSDMLVDNAAMQLVKDPAQFDTIVTSNMFGDILSDEASAITGSIGLLPSASLGNGKRGMYEPIHGSAPDIAGMNKANPIGTILSAAMMLRFSFDMDEAAERIEKAVSDVLEKGFRTADITGKNGGTPLSTTEMTDKIIENLA